MKKYLYSCASLVALLVLLALPAAGQSSAAGAAKAKTNTDGRVDLAINFTVKIEKISGLTSSSRFTIRGSSLDGQYRFSPHWGIAAEMSGDSASNIQPGVNFSEVIAAAGPRFTTTPKQKFSFYGQALLGKAFAFNSVFPTSTGAVPRASSFAMLAGGGVNYDLTKRFGWRLAEVDYALTKLPNASTSSQAGTRFSTGLLVHF